VKLYKQIDVLSVTLASFYHSTSLMALITRPNQNSLNFVFLHDIDTQESVNTHRVFISHLRQSSRVAE